MRFEVSVALGSRARVADGGNDVRELMSFGNTAALLDRPGPFSASLKALTRDVLLELDVRWARCPPLSRQILTHVYVCRGTRLTAVAS